MKRFTLIPLLLSSIVAAPCHADTGVSLVVLAAMISAYLTPPVYALRFTAATATGTVEIAK